MAYPTFLYFLIFTIFFLEHHIRIHFSYCLKTFCLYDFQINRNFIPFIIEKLICLIFIDQRYIFKSSEDIFAYYVLFFGHCKSFHVVDQLMLQIVIKTAECICKLIIKSCNIVLIFYSLFYIIRFKLKVWRFAVLEQFIL